MSIRGTVSAACRNKELRGHCATPNQAISVQSSRGKTSRGSSPRRYQPKNRPQAVVTVWGASLFVCRMTETVTPLKGAAYEMQRKHWEKQLQPRKIRQEKNRETKKDKEEL